MKRDDLIKALRRMKVETGSLVCLGCGHEHSCGTRGCAVIRAAIEALEKTEPEPEPEPARPPVMTAAVGKRIKAAREAAGMTQKQLAEKLGVSDTYVSQYERGKRNPKWYTLMNIADALGVTLNEVTVSLDAEGQRTGCILHLIGGEA